MIFRGHFNASGNESGINLTVIGGFAFAYSVFLNGRFLGSGQGNSTIAQVTDVWNIPEAILRLGKDNVLTVVQGADSCPWPVHYVDSIIQIIWGAFD